MECIKQREVVTDNKNEAADSPPCTLTGRPSQPLTSAADPDIFPTQSLSPNASIASIEEFMINENLN